MPNLKTVAEQVGVSISTVSNAYNKPDQLSSELRSRIFEAAAELGYAGPDAAARTLRSGKSWTIGLLMTERLSYGFSDPYAVQFLAGLTTACEARQIGVLLLPVVDDDSGKLRHPAIDAFATFGLGPDHPAAQAFLDRNIPFVGGTRLDEPKASWVAIDEAAAGARIGQHLSRLGHRNVAVVVSANCSSSYRRSEFATPADLEDLNSSDRFNGLAAAMPGASIQVFNSAPNSMDVGRLAGETLLDQQDRPTAIICLADVQALGVLEAMKVRGLVPGKDISLTGFDDIPAAAAAGLTTVHQPAFERGRLTGELLIDQERTDRQITLDTRLVVRSSTGPAPKSH